MACPYCPYHEDIKMVPSEKHPGWCTCPKCGASIQVQSSPKGPHPLKGWKIK